MKSKGEIKMKGSFIKIRRIIIPMITLIILMCQLTGCSLGNKKLLEMINNGQTVTIEVAQPDYEIVVRGQKQEDVDWIQLDRLKTFNMGFRQDFDSIFNISIVTDDNGDGKNGVLFIGEEGKRNGNSTLEDAFRNKAFINKYWKQQGVKGKVASLSTRAYKDVEGHGENSLAASLNAYYNLLPDHLDPTSFNGTSSLTREDFYTLVYKSEERVQNIEIDKAFENAIGGETKLSKFAQNVANDGFLQTSNKSLDISSYRGNISRAEAIYLIVNRHFSDELEKVTGKDKAFADTKNTGDLALKLGFKVRDKKNKTIAPKERWQAYTLAHMMVNEEDGMQEELYKAMVVAKNLGLISEAESRWNEVISKAEAILLIVNTHLIKNDLYGYLTTEEYGKLAKGTKEVETVENTEIDKTVLGEHEDGTEFGKDWAEVTIEELPTDPDTISEYGYTLGEAREIYDMNYAEMKEFILEGDMTQEEFDDIMGPLMEDGYGFKLQQVKNVPENYKEIAQQRRKEENKVKKDEAKQNNKGNQGNQGGTSKPSTPTNSQSGPPVFKTDKWHTKEQKEAARQRAIDSGKNMEWWDRYAREWESMTDMQRSETSAPYDEVFVPDFVDDMENPFKAP